MSFSSIKSMKKNYVLDTNILIMDSGAMHRFGDNDVWIPIWVLEELDRIKSESTGRGKASREAVRNLDELRVSGSLREGVIVGEGGLLRIYSGEVEGSTVDEKILSSVGKIVGRTILVTMDVNLRVRAEALGYQVARYESQSVGGKLWKGWEEMEVELGMIEQMYREGLDADGMRENSGVLLDDGVKLGRGIVRGGRIEGIVKSNVLGIEGRSFEQELGLELLMDDRVKLVTMLGKAGSGKSLLSCAAGLRKVLDGEYSRLIITRPVVSIGKDLGALPGSLGEKMLPWIKPMTDALDFLMMSVGKRGRGRTLEELMRDDVVVIEPLTYMRGRNFGSSFIIADEMQNSSLHEVRTLVTRVGEGSKIVLLGDIDQIDSAYLDARSNGLSHVVEKMSGISNLVGHIEFSKVERSALANLAVEVL